MNNREFKAFAASRKAKYAERGQHLEHRQSGYETVFGKPPVQVGEGWLPREGEDTDPNDVSSDLCEIANYIQAAIAKTGDQGLSDALAKVLRTVNALAKVPSGSLVEKAKVNKEGSTEPMRHVPSNNVSRRGEPQPKGGQAMPTWALEDKPDVLETKISRLTSKMLQKLHR